MVLRPRNMMRQESKRAPRSVTSDGAGRTTGTSVRLLERCSVEQAANEYGHVRRHGHLGGV